MLGEERKREIEAEEAARVAEEAYRREVRLRITQADPLPPIAARSFDPVDKAKSGLNFFQILGLVALAAAITYVYATYNADVSHATRAAKAAAGPLRLKPRYVPMKEPIANGQIIVQAGGWVTYRLRIKPAMRNAVLSGSFNASGGTGNDVSAVVASESEFQNWINGHEARVLYSTRDRKTTDSFTVELPEGEYIFAISNKFSIFSMKTVFLNADLRYDVLAEPQSNLFSGVQSEL